MFRYFVPLALACMMFPLATMASPVGQGNPCDRAGEGSQFQGQYLLCIDGTWMAQAPQAVSAGLNTTTCTTARLGLLRVQNSLGINSLQFCDGVIWKTISLL